MDIQEFKSKNPEYADVDNEVLSQALYKKHYSDSGVDYDTFKSKFNPTSSNVPQETFSSQSTTPTTSNPTINTVGNELQDDNPVFNAAAKGAGAIINPIVDTVKDYGYSLGMPIDSPAGGYHTGIGPGHIKEALENHSPPPGPLSIRTLNPFLHMMYDAGGTPRYLANVAAGTLHDLSNYAAMAEPIKLLGQGGLSLLRKLPGAAPILQEEALAGIKGSAAKLSGTHGDWSKVAKEGIPIIDQSNVLEAVQNAKKELMKPSNVDKSSVEFLNNIENRIVQGKGKLPLDLVDADRRSIGKWTKQVENKGKLEGLVDDIYSAYHADLDQAARTLPGKGPLVGPIESNAATDLQHAIDSSRKAFVKEDYSNLIEKHISTQETSGLQQIKPNKIMDDLRKTKTGQNIMKNLDPTELKDIQNTLTVYSKVPKLPPPNGATYGSGGYWMTAGFITGATKLLGADLATATAIGGTVASTPHMISKLLLTEPGRDFIRYASKANLIGRMPTTSMAIQAGKALTMKEDNRKGKWTVNDSMGQE